MLTRVWQGKNVNNVSMCAVSPAVNTSNISNCQKKLFQFSCGCEQFHWGRLFGFLVINVCNHGEHFETPCIYHYVYMIFSNVCVCATSHNTFQNKTMHYF
jgi:hypothetical protein